MSTVEKPGDQPPGQDKDNVDQAKDTKDKEETKQDKKDGDPPKTGDSTDQEQKPADDKKTENDASEKPPDSERPKSGRPKSGRPKSGRPNSGRPKSGKKDEAADNKEKPDGNDLKNKPDEPDTAIQLPRDECPTGGATTDAEKPAARTPRNIVSPPLSSRPLEAFKGGPCDVCPLVDVPKTSDAEFVCDACDQRLCVRCAKRHLETPAFSTHDVAPLTLSPEDDVTGLQTLECRIHERKVLEYVCEGCQVAACCLCISFNHGGRHHHIRRVQQMDSNKHVLLTRYERLLRGEPASCSKKAIPAKDRPVPVLLWKKESLRKDAQDETDTEDPACLCGPNDITFLPCGQVVVSDRWNRSLKVFDSDGSNGRAVLRGRGVAPLRLCALPSGGVAVVDYSRAGIWFLTEESLLSTSPCPADASPDTQQQPSTSRDQPATTKDSPGETSEDPQRQPDIGHSRQSDRSGLHSKQSLRGNDSDVVVSEHLDVVMNCKEDSLWKPEHFKCPYAVAMNRFGELLVSQYKQYQHSSVTLHDFEGYSSRSFGCHGEGDDQLEWPGYLVSDSRGRVIISDYWNHAVKIFDHRGHFVTKIGQGWGKKDGQLTFPKGVCVDNDDFILVVDSGNNRVCEFAPDGTFVRSVLTQSDGLVEPEGIAFVEMKDKDQGKVDSEGQQTGENSLDKESPKDPSKDKQTPRENPDRVSERHIAVTLSKGHQYSAVLVYNLEPAGSGPS